MLQYVQNATIVILNLLTSHHVQAVIKLLLIVLVVRFLVILLFAILVQTYFTYIQYHLTHNYVYLLKNVHQLKLKSCSYQQFLLYVKVVH